MARHRYRRHNEYPGIVILIMGRWCRIHHPPYGIEVVA
jgi:hypothetical protein